jgi:hypothetical protein
MRHRTRLNLSAWSVLVESWCHERRLAHYANIVSDCEDDQTRRWLPCPQRAGKVASLSPGGSRQWTSPAGSSL